MKEVRINVKGRVQGVNLRYMIKRFSDKLGVVGYVRNEEDGSVFVLAQGEKEMLDEFLDWLKKSPGISNVREIKSDWREVEDNLRDFFIKRDF